MKFLKRAGIIAVAVMASMMMLLPSAEIAFAEPTAGSQSGSSSSSSQQSQGTSTSGQSSTGTSGQSQSETSGNSTSGGSSISGSGSRSYSSNTSGSSPTSGSTSGSSSSSSTTGNASVSGSTSTSGTTSSSASSTNKSSKDTSSGSAKHQASKANDSLDSLSSYYYDSNHKQQKRHKDEIAISFTGGASESVSNMDRIGTYYTDEQKAYPVSFLMDTGNASSEAPLSAIFSSQAPVYRIMGAAGYDAVGIGRGELSFGASSVASALNAAVKSQDIVPYLSCSNVSVSGSLKKAYKNFGVENYTLITRYGKKIAVFSVISKSAFDKAGITGVKYSDYVKTAEQTVRKIQKKVDPDLIICLANTTDSSSLTESSKLSSIPGLDLVLTGGGKGKTQESSGKAAVVQSAAASSLNTVVFKTSGKSYKYSKVITADLNKVSKKASVTSEIKKYNKLSDSAYFSKYGLPYRETLADNSIDFGSASALSQSRTDLGFTNLLTDSYIYAARHMAGVKQSDVVSIMSPKTVSSVFSKGTLTSGDIYADLGSGSSGGTSGSSLKYFYLTGKELQNVAELTSSEYKSDASKRLYFGGVSYIYNPHRVLSNKVYQFRLKDQNGNTKKVDSSKRYLVVADENAAAVLKTISKGHGQSLSVSPKASNGHALSNIPYLKSGSKPVKVWGAAARYVKSMGSIPSKYSKSGVRMVYDGSILPSHLLKETNGVAGIILAIAVIVIAVVILLIILLIHIFRGGRGGGFGGRRRHDRDIFGGGGRGRRNRYPKRRKKERSIFTNK
ncbi:MAG: bifunctional metallophosphatase/5'-nucleotidase [Eubacterium sp.]|nr:bifunctional metallophosphatase/5'-nucleotidase [Eubacterium sp.]MCH4047520.1 bifunctional metallophosphatase/5'-nucleotidase [Eubacterium sp.]MCH4078290.1 bifunctional metallophosphatase/5'-nucleotidase [Eubacterium sp.]MCH4109437.1 bifunctional metallophosphatase/5'-nucleotidase [Eubacterium sp.]MCI1307591.1 bifunctional metallophosphatase/5'-nucleotidase [Eubacterium sp.]